MGFLLKNMFYFTVLLWLSSLPNAQAAVCGSYRPDECEEKYEENCKCRMTRGECMKSDECGDGIGITSDSDYDYLPVGGDAEVLEHEGSTIGAYKEDCRDDDPTCFQMTPSLKDCGDHCKDHAACNSFAFCTGSGNPRFPRCYLKTKKVDFMTKSHHDCTTYKSDGRPLANAYNLVARTEGLNLASYKEDCTEDPHDVCHKTTPTLESCKEYCDQQDGCKSFAYCTGVGHPTLDFTRCYLKTGDFDTKRHGGGDCKSYYPSTPAMCKDAKRWYQEQGCCGAPMKDLNMNMPKPGGRQHF